MSQAACITTSWDDGHPLDLRVAELLTKHGLQGTFYVPRVSERSTLAAAQIRQLSSSFELGAHTLHHVDLTRAQDATATAEIVKSKPWLEDVTGQPCVMFCPPLGRYEQRHMPIVRAAGYLGMRTVELLSLDWPRLRSGLHIMPTTIQAYPHRAMAYTRNAIRRGAFHNLWLYILHGQSGGWDAMAESLAMRMLRNGGVFHLWGHSWELEETGQWQRLEKVLEMLSHLKELAPSVSNGQACLEAQKCQAKAHPDSSPAIKAPPVAAPIQPAGSSEGSGDQ
ncbi:MAG: polysaccharide deacetylase family protein [Bacillota bacterium]